jgi:hypothetical protein
LVLFKGTELHATAMDECRQKRFYSCVGVKTDSRSSKTLKGQKKMSNQEMKQKKKKKK